MHSSINLAFLSNDVCSYFLHWCDNLSETKHSEEHGESESFKEDEFSGECEYSVPNDEAETLHSCKSSNNTPSTSSFVSNQKECSAKLLVSEKINSVDDMKRILSWCYVVEEGIPKKCTKLVPVLPLITCQKRGKKRRR